MAHKLRITLLLWGTLVAAPLGMAHAAHQTVSAMTHRTTTIVLPIVGFNSGITALFALDTATPAHGTAFYYYQGEPYYSLGAGALSYTRSGTTVTINGLLNPTGDPHDDRQMQWQGTANIATGGISVGGWDPLTAYRDTITTTPTRGNRRQADFVAQTGFYLYTLGRFDLSYLLASAGQRHGGAAAYTRRMRTTFFPRSVQDAQMQMGGQEDAFSIRGNTAIATDHLVYNRNNMFVMRECQQHLVLDQHGWRLDRVVCSPPQS